MSCHACGADLASPFVFCGQCGARQDRKAQEPSADPLLHYAGPSGQTQLPPSAIAPHIRAAPEARHMVWKHGWPQWRVWREVPELADALDSPAELVEPAPEDPAKLAEYQSVLHEMLTDGVLETWESEVLAELRAEHGISMVTHDRLAEAYKPLRTGLLTAAVDQCTMRGFRSGEHCVMQLRLGNASTKGLRRIEARVATSATTGVVSVQTSRVAPQGHEVVLVRLTPDVAGQHEFHCLLTAIPYIGRHSHYRIRSFTFSVARPPAVPGTQVINMDLSAMQVGKIGNVGSAPQQAEAGLVQEASWVTVHTSPLTQAEAQGWVQTRGAALPRDPAQTGTPPPPTGAPAPPTDRPPPEAPTAGLSAADPTWKALVDSGLDCGLSLDQSQAWCLSREFPKAFIQWAWSKGLFVVDLWAGLERHWCLVGKRSGWQAQRWKRGSREAVRSWIKQQWAQGWYLTGCDVEPDSWVAIVTQGTGWTMQAYTTTGPTPESWIQRRVARGEHVAGLQAGPELWVCWTAEGTGWQRQRQTVSTSWMDVRASVLEGWKVGFFVTSFAWRNRRTCAISTSGCGITQQGLTPCPSPRALGEAIAEKWADGARVHLVGHDDDTFWLFWGTSDGTI